MLRRRCNCPLIDPSAHLSSRDAGLNAPGKLRAAATSASCFLLITLLFGAGCSSAPEDGLQLAFQTATLTAIALWNI